MGQKRFKILSPYSAEEAISRIVAAFEPLPPGWPRRPSMGMEREIRTRVTGDHVVVAYCGVARQGGRDAHTQRCIDGRIVPTDSGSAFEGELRFRRDPVAQIALVGLALADVVVALLVGDPRWLVALPLLGLYFVAVSHGYETQPVPQEEVRAMLSTLLGVLHPYVGWPNEPRPDTLHWGDE